MPELRAVDTARVAQIVRSYVAHNPTAPGKLPNLIATVHQSLVGLGSPINAATPQPAVAINRSYGQTFVICLDCGWRGQMLRRHLTTSHALSTTEYRARWNLKDAHPLVAPAYTQRRSALARELGLGRKRPVADPAIAPRRRGRPRASAPPPT